MLKLDDPRQLWRRYALALSVVLTLLGASHVASTRALQGGEEDAAIINLAGRQRMLSQRILYFALETKRRESELGTLRLTLAIDRFERTHLALTRGGDLGLTAAGAERRAPAYAEAPDGRSLDGMSRSFVADARAVMEGTPAERDEAWERMRVFGPTTLLRRLDRAVKIFEHQAAERTGRTRDVARATFGLAILVVLFEVVLIFWPAQRMVSASIARLNRANDALRRSHAEAEAARDEARRAMRVRTRFLTNMSHELRTPLNGVMGMLDLLADAPDPEARERARTAHASASHLLELLDDVLDLARMESGRLALEEVPFDPRRLGREALRVLADQAGAKGLALRLDDRGCGAPLVLGDPTRLRQVLINLVGNAVKFTDAGEVVLRVAHDGARLRLEVRDTGIGIPAERRAALFDPFVQADASTTRRHGGSGLGLAICREIVTAMGGGIGLADAPGGGSVFRVEIPAPAAEAPAEPAPDPDRPAAPGLRVLVAEDNGVNRRVVEAFLRRLGHEAVCVADGARAVEAVRDAELAFDVVLMDVQMPVMDGVAATRAIRALGPRGALPILALTAHALEGQREEVMEAGMDGHLAKPIRPDALGEALADAAWSARARAGDASEVRRASA